MPAKKHSAPSARTAQEHGTDPIGLERLVFFSDAVFAIAITLLALDVRLPPDLGELSNRALLAQLLSLGTSYLAFVISFLVIGIFWIGHHRRFAYIQRYDRRLIWLNLLLLMGIAFTPFPTSVLAKYGNSTATIFYALTMAAIGLLQLLIWLYASANRRLVSVTTATHTIRHETLLLAVAPIVFLLSALVALFSADIARVSWLLFLPLSFLLRERGTTQ